MILINGQWQGGGSRETLDAALAAAEALAAPFVEAPVSSEHDLPLKDGIIGHDAIREQIRKTLTLLSDSAPDGLFTLGGGCDADVASIAFMNARYGGKLKVIWMDAHGDLNAPAESASHLFYGMPLRALLGGCPPMRDLIPIPLRPDQVIHVGGRDLDDSEVNYIRETPIEACPACDGSIVKQEEILSIAGRGGDVPVYVHFDMDVLDPGDFSQTPLPVCGGVAAENALAFIRAIQRRGTLVGLGIFEFLPDAVHHPVLETLMDIGKAIGAR